MTNIDEIKARAESIAKSLEYEVTYALLAEYKWAATTILELCGEVERLKAAGETCIKSYQKTIAELQNELAEKDAVLAWYAKMGHEKADAVLQKYRKSEG